MRRISSVARWALCACLLTISNPLDSQSSAIAEAQAQTKAKVRKALKTKKTRKAKTAKSVRRCVNFTQTLGTDEESVDLQLTSDCKFEIACSVQWELQCSSSEGNEEKDASTQATTLEYAESWNLNASASVCEVDWEIRNVSWQCAARE